VNGPTTVSGTLTVNQSTAITITGDLTVNGTLSFVIGKITTANNTITIGISGTITGADQSTGWIVGNLKKLSALNTNPTFNYAIGDSNNYTPLALTFSGTTSATGGLTAKINIGDHAQVASSGIDVTKSVNKTWTLTNDSLADFGTYSAAFGYSSADIDAGSTPVNYIVKLFNGFWSSITTSGTPTDTATTAIGISGFGDFAIGEVDALSINENTTKAFKLYPNPINDGILYINSDNSSEKALEIYDLVGKKVFSAYSIIDKVDIKSLKTGIYLAKVKTKNEATVQKIVIKNN
jgi:hypothetical protein